MDEYGTPIPGSSTEFESEEIMESNDCDFLWLEKEFKTDDVSEDEKMSIIKVHDLSNSHDCEIVEIESGPNKNIDNFFEEIKRIDFSQTKNLQINDTIVELLERCKNFIDIVGRNIIFLEESMLKVQKNIDISIRNATKAYECIKFENKSMFNISLDNLKKKADLANYFKIKLSNCPRNPHLSELYETGKLILSYNGRFMLEECVEKNLWNQEFKNKLEKAIHEEVLDKIKTPMLAQHLRLGQDKEQQCDPIIKQKIKLEMLDLEKELDVISKTPFQHLVFQFMDSDTKYDWLHIAKVINKPELQCQRYWNLMLKPHISRNKWTKDENNKLIEISKKYGERNWQQIAIELDTNRNELQCFVHYQKNKKLNCKKGKWLKNEDLKLAEIVKENSVGNIINWQKVYFAMRDEGRSVDQIYNRWMFSLRPGIKKGLLNERERFIINLAQKNNLPPSVVSMNLTNRTTTQVRNAYRRNVLCKTNNFRGGWTPEEDKLLLCAVNPYAPNELTWSQVAKNVPGRNAEQCRHRFKLIEKRVQNNPNLIVDNFPRLKKKYKISQPDLPDDSNLQENFKQNRKLLHISNEPIETSADRKLKKSLLDNVYVTKHCNFSSKCDLLKHILDYLGADLVIPQQFVHKDDLVDEGLMSMMNYLKECSIEAFTLKPSSTEESIDDLKFNYEGIHGVLRSSDIINSDLSEIEGLFDIRIRNFECKISENINNQNLHSIKKQTQLPLSYYMGSVPPNFETFRMLYTYNNNMNTSLKFDSLKDNDKKFNWSNEQSKKLQQQLVAILRWPVLFSGMVNYNAPIINMMMNTEQAIETKYSESRSFYKNKKNSH